MAGFGEAVRILIGSSFPAPRGMVRGVGAADGEALCAFWMHEESGAKPQACTHEAITPQQFAVISGRETLF
jgi:hypothetical protein